MNGRDGGLAGLHIKTQLAFMTRPTLETQSVLGCDARVKVAGGNRGMVDCFSVCSMHVPLCLILQVLAQTTLR
jgi:hypothetical protein